MSRKKLMSAERKIYNPIQKDYVTFLKARDETGGECTLVVVELAHCSSIKTRGGATAEKNIHHRFFNNQCSL